MRNKNLLLNSTDVSSEAKTFSIVEPVAIKIYGRSRLTGVMLGFKKIKYSASAAAARRSTTERKNILRNFFTENFGVIKTELFQLAFRAFRVPCSAHIAPMQYKPVMRNGNLVLRNIF